MSANNFYLEKGYTPETKYQQWETLTTLAIWAPPADKRVVITGLTISNNAETGTFRIIFNNTTASKVAEFTVGASLTISPLIGAIESTAYGIEIMGRPSTSSSTGGWRVSAQGFEIP